MNERELLNLCLEQLHDLVYSFEEAKSLDTLPEAFLEENEERLETLRSLFGELGQAPAEVREEELIGETKEEPQPVIPVQPKEIVPELKETSAPVLLEEQIARTIYADLRKSLSLNDRFRFQRDLFGNDAQRMEQALSRLNEAGRYDEALAYLSESFDWDWESESAMAFKELLQKRFA